MKRLTKFPVKSVLGLALLTYGISAEVFEFGSQWWFPKTRPDLIAHVALGYFSSAIGRSFRNNDLSSRLVGLAGISAKETFDVIRYGTLSAISPTDLMAGITGILLENYSNLRESLNERS